MGLEAVLCSQAELLCLCQVDLQAILCDLAQSLSECPTWARVQAVFSNQAGLQAGLNVLLVQ